MATQSASSGSNADPDRHLRYRLRKARERRRRQQPVEEELTTIYIADGSDALGPEAGSGGNLAPIRPPGLSPLF